MKNKKLIKLITPLTVVTSLATCTAFTGCTTSKTEDKQTKTQPKLRFDLAAKDLDLNSESTPLTIVNDETAEVTCVVKVPKTTTVKLYFRQSTVEGEGWTDWKECTYQESEYTEDNGKTFLQLQPNTTIQLAAYNSATSPTTAVFSTKDDPFSITFDGFTQGWGKVGWTDANVTIGGSAYSLLLKNDPSTQLLDSYFDELDATDSQYIFYNLFKGSSNLKYIPRDFLPFQSVVPHCYEGMFNGCSKLVEVPALYATTHNTGTTSSPVRTNGLAESCYQDMFDGCAKIHTAPVLPARILADNCYASMFQGCTTLMNISLGYVGNFYRRYFKDWVHGVTGSGKIFYNGLDDARSNNELPAHFTVISEDATTLAEYTKDLTFMAGASATFDQDDTKLTVRCYKDSTLGEVVSGSMTKPSSAVETASDSVWYYEGTSGSSLEKTLTVDALDATKKIVGDFTTPSAFIEGATNIVVLEETTLKLSCTNQSETACKISISEDDGENWTELTNQSTTSVEKTLSAGTEGKSKRYLLKGNLGEISSSPSLHIKFINGSIQLGGSVMALIAADSAGIAPEGTELPDWGVYYGAFNSLFAYSWRSGAGDAADSAHATVASNFLPAMDLKPGCYQSMFENWQNMTSAPDLPALVMKESCYKQMFCGCGIIKAPELPATTLATNCYAYMFCGDYYDTFLSGQTVVTHLEQGPTCLPATTLEKGCYDHMFYSADKLKEAPIIGDGQTTLTVPEGSYVNTFGLMFLKKNGTSAMVKPPIFTHLPKLSKEKHYGLFANVLGSSNSYKRKIQVAKYQVDSTWEECLYYEYDGEAGTDYQNIFSSYFSYFTCIDGTTDDQKWQTTSPKECDYPKPGVHYYYKAS